MQREDVRKGYFYSVKQIVCRGVNRNQCKLIRPLLAEVHNTCYKQVQTHYTIIHNRAYSLDKLIKKLQSS